MEIDNKPLISVIIPNYNRAEMLSKALQSVMDQTYTNWEAIVIDNHSSDDPESVISVLNDERITLLKIHNEGVIAASRNLGIRAANGDWIAFLDSDDWWSKRKLQVCLSYITNKTDLVYHDLEICGQRQKLFQRKKVKCRKPKKPVLLDLLLRGNYIANSSVMIRKSIYAKIGEINESPDIVPGEDYSTWLRIARVTDCFLYLPKTLGTYFLHNDNISQRDMSEPFSAATADFIDQLTLRQKLSVKSQFHYIRGSHNYRQGNFRYAISDLWLCLRYPGAERRVKSLLMLIRILLRKNRTLHD